MVDNFELDPHPEIPEGVNASKTLPIVDFAYMLAGVGLIILLIMLVAQLSAGVMVRHISFQAERELFDRFAPEDIYEDAEENIQKTRYLQSLADELVPLMQLPPGVMVEVHYDPSDIPNAYATLGGHIVIYQGLIDEVSSENGLAMVLAHEIAHIKNRDPIMSLGRGTVSLIGLAILSGFGDSSSMGALINVVGGGFLAKFSRDQESQADQDAVAAVFGKYGTVQGADEFFINMSRKPTDMGLVFFSTHPNTDERIARIAASSGSDESLVPLPNVLLGNASEGR